MTPHHGAALALSLAVLAGAAFAAPGHPPWRSPASPGLRSYRYEVIETANGQVEKGYRADFDLKTGRDGVIDARVLTAAERATARLGPGCRDRRLQARHACAADRPASVRLWPVKQAGRPRWRRILADSAPDAGVPAADGHPRRGDHPGGGRTSRRRALRKVGDRATYDGFNAAFNRSGRSIKETSPRRRGACLCRRRRRHHRLGAGPGRSGSSRVGPQNQTIGLKGTEHFAFRVQIDTRTGALISGRTTYDDLDLAMHLTGVPDDKLPRQKITRAVRFCPASRVAIALPLALQGRGRRRH